MSRWDVARAAIGCEGGCRQVIGAGEALRRVGGLEWPCCVGCAKQRFDLEPPAEMPVEKPFRFRRVVTESDVPGMTPVGAIPLPPEVKLPRDFKVAQSKDGE